MDNSDATSKPDIDDYLELFGRYEKDFGPVYLEAEDQTYRLLFDQMCRLLAKPSHFNLNIPQEFRITAQRWLNGDEEVHRHMREPQMRHFMLSDLYDYMHLRKTMGYSPW